MVIKSVDCSLGLAFISSGLQENYLKLLHLQVHTCEIGIRAVPFSYSCWED
jgi:hypothetical protein